MVRLSEKSDFRQAWQAQVTLNVLGRWFEISASAEICRRSNLRTHRGCTQHTSASSKLGVDPYVWKPFYGWPWRLVSNRPSYCRRSEVPARSKVAIGPIREQG